MSRINDLVAKYPDLFGDGAIRTEMERLESQWMAEQEISDQEQIALASQPEQASLKATETSMARAQKTFDRLQEIRQEAEEKVIAQYGQGAIDDLTDEEDANQEEEINLVPFDYDFIITIGLALVTVIGVGVFFIKTKKAKGGKKDE